MIISRWPCKDRSWYGGSLKNKGLLFWFYIYTSALKMLTVNWARPLTFPRKSWYVLFEISIILAVKQMKGINIKTIELKDMWNWLDEYTNWKQN